MLLDSDKTRILHMIESAETAVAFSVGRDGDAVMPEVAFKAVLVRSFEIIGEAASRVGNELRARHPEIPWRVMIDMRNRLIHAYFDIDLKVLQQTVKEELPSLIKNLSAILETEFAE